MKSFISHLITEARVSPQNFEKVVDIFKRLVEKKVGHRLYRYGGAKGMVELKKGMGIMYIYNANKAIRFNHKGNEIESITVWDNYKLGSSGDRTIDLDGIGLLQGAHKLIDIVTKERQPGKHRMYAMVDINENFLAEAKRTTVEDFAQLVIDKHPNPAKVSWQEIESIAVNNDVQIPSVVRGNKQIKTGKGKNATFNFNLLLSSPAASSSKTNDVVPDYYIKITAQDPNTKKFQSVKGDERAAKMLAQISGSIKEPKVEQEMKDPSMLFGIMKNLVQLVARGSRNSLVIYGGPGTGKTFVVNQTLKNEGLSKGSDYQVIKGKLTTAALYKTLFLHRKGTLLVFDDTDSVWGDQDAGNILKAALDSYDERMISWYSARTVNVGLMSPEEKEELNDNLDLKIKTDATDSVKLPSEFEYEGRIIFISNLPYEKFDSAVLTRSAKIDMTLTDAQMFMRIEGIIEDIGDPAVDIQAKKDILMFIRERNAQGLLKAPSMRTFVAAEDLYKSGLPNWKELLEYV